MRRPCLSLVLLLSLLQGWALAQPATGTTNGTLAPGPVAQGVGGSTLLEVAGRVEVSAADVNQWQPAQAGQTLAIGARVRTHAQSRAAIQLSDRSIIRLNEYSTLEILPPRKSEKRRFGLPRGSIFFFNREKPSDVEFDTPVAAGAIRGTEFLLEISGDSAALHLALIDGKVSLQRDAETVAMERGEDVRLLPGQLPQRAPLIHAAQAIQWALYYPAVIAPGDLRFSETDRAVFAPSLELYRAGDALAALAALPANAGPGESRGGKLLRAALALAVGRVDEAEQRLREIPAQDPGARALRELIHTVREDDAPPASAPESPSEWLARSYSLQATADLPGALAAAQQATREAPEFGLAYARVAELELAFENGRAADAALARAEALSPRLATLHAVRGFTQLARGDVAAARAAFDRARALDSAFGPAWLGRGLCLLSERQYAAARAAFQAAAALEPQRSLFRSYLGKAASEMGDAAAAEKEFRLAHGLDPADPTSWLYSALHLWRENRLNEAIRDLEHSLDLNDRRASFRSRLLLDQDRAVRSANLAALYEDAGLAEVSRRTASRSVVDDYGNFSGHLFLANSYQALEDGNRFDLRTETARQSELLVANLLAPPGAGNLSQLLSQHEHLRFFETRPIGVSSVTEYGSAGDWRQRASVFGTLGGLSYAVDGSYENTVGQRANESAERRQAIVTVQQRVSAQDTLYFQAGRYTSSAGDLASYYDPAEAKAGFRVREKQEPTLYAGWHRTWAPGSHTLLLLARLDDRLQLVDPEPSVLFLRQRAGTTVGVDTPPLFDLNLASDFTLYSAELQQIWETPEQSWVIGGRWQSGDVQSRATLNRTATGVVTDQREEGSLERGNVYAYSSWQILDPLRLIAGVSYDRIRFPANTDLAPISHQEATRDLVEPKVGLLLTPWERGTLRASYTRSMGGLFFDNSVRLEPTQVAGFNQAFRSLIPESVAGLVPGTRFDTAAVGFDQFLGRGTWLGAELEWLHSKGDRVVGALTNSGLLFPDTASSTREVLGFRERNVSAYAAQLLGDWFSVATRYRYSEAQLQSQFPEIPPGTPGLAALQSALHSRLHQVTLAGNFYHPSGVFARWESTWWHQNNSGYSPARPGDDFWQHNVFVGYRFPRRYAEVQLGLLNLLDRDYRLNPLNLQGTLPRERTFTASLRLNF